MCGINGFNFEDNSLINSMNYSLKHRGPDGKGSFVDKGISLGQTRLSILDLSDSGHQPMFYSKKKGSCSTKFNPNNVSNSKVSIVFNGEIYNYLELREDLSNIGYVFSSESDTEVILASYLEYGFDCVKNFNGMRSFCIHDQRKNILFCSRDRLGQKPFYYYLRNNNFIFSSELKGILEHKGLGINSSKNINISSMKLYFSLGFIPSPFSIYKNVSKLESSHNLVFDLDKKSIKKIWKYFEIDNIVYSNDKKSLINEGKKLIKDSVKLRMRSDVPVGAFLSGGLDSSTVVGQMKTFIDLNKLHTFSIGFEGKYDESDYIKIVKDYFKTKHHHKYFKKKDFLNMVDTYPLIYDEPFGDYSGFPTNFVSKMARKDVTVSLSGDGGDEIFGGYTTHVNGYRMELIRKVPLFIRQLISKLPAKKNLNTQTSFYLLKEAMNLSLKNKNCFYSDSLINERYLPKEYIDWTRETLGYCLKKGNNNLGEALRIHDLLYNTLSDHFLTKVDRASMANSLEVRSPFLDYRFINFAQKIPLKWKIGIFGTKLLLRDIISALVPKKIVNRGKWGFTPPLDKWILDDEFKGELDKYLGLIEGIDIELHNFYKEMVMVEENRMYNVYRIRLFLFGRWFEEWVR